MINKIRKFLLRHKEIVQYKKCESGSEYFKVGNSKIRLSDHIATSLNDPSTLNIIVNDDNFVITYGNRIIINNDYNEFKGFLKYHIKMCQCFKPLFKKLSKKTVIAEPIAKNTSENIDVSSLTNKQVKAIQKMISTFNVHNNKS